MVLICDYQKKAIARNDIHEKFVTETKPTVKFSSKVIKDDDDYKQQKVTKTMNKASAPARKNN